MRLQSRFQLEYIAAASPAHLPCICPGQTVRAGSSCSGMDEDHNDESADDEEWEQDDGEDEPYDEGQIEEISHDASPARQDDLPERMATQPIVAAPPPPPPLAVAHGKWRRRLYPFYNPVTLQWQWYQQQCQYNHWWNTQQQQQQQNHQQYQPAPTRSPPRRARDGRAIAICCT